MQTRKKRKHLPQIFLRFIVMYLIIIFIPTFMLNLFVYKNSFKYMQKSMEDSTFDMLSQVHTMHGKCLQQMQNAVDQIQLTNVFCSPFELENALDKALKIRDTLNVLTQANPYFDNVLFYFPEDDYIYTNLGTCSKNLFCRTLDDHLLQDYSESLNDVVNTGRTAIIGIHHTSELLGSVESTGYCFPITVKGSSKNAILIFQIPNTIFQSLFTGSNMQFGDSYIFQEGLPVFEQKNIHAPASIVSGMNDSEQNVQYLKSEGVKYLTLHIYDSRFRADYFQIFSLHDIFEPFYQTRSSFIVLNIIIAGLCGCIMFYFSYLNYNPIKKLSALLSPGKADAAAKSRNELNQLMASITDLYEKNQSLDTKINQSLAAQRSMLLLDFIKGRFTNKDSVLDICEEAGFHIQRSHFIIMLIKFSPSSGLGPSDAAVKEILTQPLEKIDSCATELLSSNTIAVVSFFDDIEAERAYQKDLWDQLTAAAFEGHLAFSNAYSDISNASKAFIEAYSSLTYRNISKRSVIHFSDIQVEKVRFKEYPFDLIADLEKAVSKKQEQKAEQIIEKLFHILQSENTPHILIRCALGDIIDVYIKRCIENEIDSDDFCRLYISAQTADIGTNLKQMQEDLVKVSRKFFGTVTQNEVNQNKNNEDFMLEIIQYINTNCFDENFSLLETAEHFGLSPSQLSNQFKSTLNITPITYIAERKLRHGKYLLTHTDMSIADICSRLGYSDTSSFIRRFKNMTGKTPANYRRDEMKSNNPNEEP